MLSNFEQIRGLLSFGNKEDIYYHLQIISRKKDHPDMTGANRLIKSYYITSLDHFDNVKEEVVKLCELFGARAYINLAPKSARKTTLLQVKYLSERMYEEDYKKIWRSWNTCAGEVKGEEQAWVVDMDDCNTVDWNMVGYIRELEPKGADKIIAIIQTKSGFHIISRPFRLDKFKERYPGIDVHKNNPTILYVP